MKKRTILLGLAAGVLPAMAQPKVGTVFLYYHVGIDNVEHRLRHLLYCPTTDILAVLEDELCILIFRTPCLESIYVENVCRNDVNVYVDRSNVIVLLQTCTYKDGGL